MWDAGTWEPHETTDPQGAVAGGELHLDLYGEKLRGRFVLVRTRTDSSGKEEWLMLHKHDDVRGHRLERRRISRVPCCRSGPTTR